VTKRFGITERVALELRGAFYNAFNHAQYTPGAISTVQAVSSSTTRNNLIPGNPVFNDPSRVYSSHPRNIHLAGRITF
jgi:hypothetical protein